MTGGGGGITATGGGGGVARRTGGFGGTGYLLATLAGVGFGTDLGWYEVPAVLIDVIE
jgi:hypothetical protein